MAIWLMICFQRPRMFGSFAKLFKKSTASRQAPPPPPPDSATEQESVPSPPAEETSAPVAAAPATSGADCVTLALSSIMKNVPKELQGRLAGAGLAGFNFSLSPQRVISQLAQGSVKVPFGELRMGSPAGVFASTRDHDKDLIELPLGEIMRQLQTESFARRPNQKHLDVPEEIGNIFGGKGQPLSQVRLMDKTEVARTAPAPVQPSPAAAKIAPAAAVAAEVVAEAPTPPVAPVPLKPFAGFSSAKKSQATAAPPAAAPAKKPAPAPTPARVQRKSAPLPAPASEPVVEAPLVVPLAAIAEGWPARVRSEIAKDGLTGATCELPFAEIGAALRTGKVEYAWKQIRAWIRPALPDAEASDNADLALELPLKVLAPAYLQRSGATPAHKPLAGTHNIPDVFSKTGAPAAAPEPQAEVPAAVELGQSPAPETSAVAAPPAESAPAAPAPNRPAVLILPLSLVNETWPDPVRREVDQFKLSDAKLEVPFEVIEEGLKLGRLHFRWRQVCTWLRPAPPANMTSANLNTAIDYRVDLPLNFVAPLYLQHRSQGARKKSSFDASIPDIFNPASAPAKAVPAPEQETEPAAVSAAPQAPSSSKATKAPAAKESKRPSADMAELFGEPGKRNWTPNDIVHKTAGLPGVAGALIALQDGLLVANCMPPTWKTETIAAFLPQIFGRMSQYTNELKMGDLQSVTFTVEEGTLQIFNAGIIYFAALGRVDATLPLAELNIIAKEISRHTK